MRTEPEAAVAEDVVTHRELFDRGTNDYDLSGKLAPEDRLPNPHLMITGETGSGKTQATKAILADMRPFEVPALILDFNGAAGDRIDLEGQTYTMTTNAGGAELFLHDGGIIVMAVVASVVGVMLGRRSAGSD